MWKLSGRNVAQAVALDGQTIGTHTYDHKKLSKLTPEAAGSTLLLRERAGQLEQQANQLRKLAQAVHVHQVLKELARLFQRKEEEVPYDLHGGLAKRRRSCALALKSARG